jgi:hypothetical protein
MKDGIDQIFLFQKLIYRIFMSSMLFLTTVKKLSSSINPIQNTVSSAILELEQMKRHVMNNNKD